MNGKYHKCPGHGGHTTYHGSGDAGHTHPGHTDPEFQAIVQGLEVSSPSFRAILGVLFCDYDVSQGLTG